MTFSPINVTNGSTPANATWANNAQTQYTEASLSFNPDVFTSGFVLSGLIASKDGTTANKLDVTAGTAYVLQSADSTPRQRSLAASSQTTSAISSTYYLYLQPDGTWYWSTSNAPATNSLYICSVTTDSSGNISGVTDHRTTVAKLFPGMVGSDLTLPAVSGLSAFGPQSGQYAGTVYGGVTTGQAGAIAGDSDKCMQFDGSTGYITADATGLPSGGLTSGAAIEAWVKIAATPTAYAIVCRFGANPVNNAMELGFNSSGYPYVGFNGGNAATSTSLLSLNVWHHLVGAFSAGTLALSVDGTQVAQNASAGTPSIGTTGLAIGAAALGGSGSYLNGSIDEVAVYNSALSPARISAHYNIGHAGSNTTTYAATVFSDSPLRYYRLGDASGRGAANTTTEHAQVVAQDGSIAPTYVSAVAGQSTAGLFGVPVIVAQAVDVHVTAKTLQTILSYTPPTVGPYRVTMAIQLNNAVSGNAITAQLNWTDRALGAGNTDSSYFTAPVGNPVIALAGVTSVPNGGIITFTQTVMVAANQPMSVQYQDPTNTPNDYVSAFIERLA